MVDYTLNRVDYFSQIPLTGLTLPVTPLKLFPAPTRARGIFPDFLLGCLALLFFF